MRFYRNSQEQTENFTNSSLIISGTQIKPQENKRGGKPQDDPFTSVFPSNNLVKVWENALRNYPHGFHIVGFFLGMRDGERKITFT